MNILIQLSTDNFYHQRTQNCTILKMFIDFLLWYHSRYSIRLTEFYLVNIAHHCFSERTVQFQFLVTTFLRPFEDHDQSSSMPQYQDHSLASLKCLQYPF